MKLLDEEIKKNGKVKTAINLKISVGCLNRFLSGSRTPKVVKAIANYFNLTISEVLNENNK